MAAAKPYPFFKVFKQNRGCYVVEFESAAAVSPAAWSLDLTKNSSNESWPCFPRDRKVRESDMVFSNTRQQL